MTQPMTIEQAIGRALRQYREAARASQADVAAVARSLSLRWNQSTVTQLELGRRQVSLGEFLLLPLVLAHLGDPETGGQVVDLTALLPEGSTLLKLAPGLNLPSRIVRLLLSDNPDRIQAHLPNPAQVGAGEAERKAARTLRCSPDAVLAAAESLWGHSLAAERDRRLSDPSATPQKRGRVTRRLIQELAATLKQRKRRKP
jgi:transcriptional regulator with XRE-family HTH domain